MRFVSREWSLRLCRWGLSLRLGWVISGAFSNYVALNNNAQFLYLFDVSDILFLECLWDRFCRDIFRLSRYPVPYATLNS